MRMQSLTGQNLIIKNLFILVLCVRVFRGKIDLALYWLDLYDKCQLHALANGAFGI